MLLDLTMPQPDGVETLRRVDPEVCVVVTSGYALPARNAGRELSEPRRPSLPLPRRAR